MDQIRAMRTFVRVADAGSFVNASRLLDVAPAVVTRAVADLEHHLGARLVNRTTRRMALTDIGERYLERARAILDDIDHATALVSAVGDVAQGTVRLAAPPAFAAQLLADRLPRFAADHERVTVQLSAIDASEAQVHDHDITILVSAVPLDGSFVARPLSTCDVVACAAPAYLQRRGRPQQPDDLSEHDLLLASGGAASRSAVELQRCDADDERVGVLPRRCALASSDDATRLSAALGGLGIAVLPAFVAEAALRDGRLERVLPGWRFGTLTTWACMPSRRHVPAGTRALMDFLVAEFGSRAAVPTPAPRPRQRHADEVTA